MKKLNLVHNYKIWFAVSLLVMVSGLVMALTTGVNLGIDFTGGTQIQIDIKEAFEVEDIKPLIEEYDLEADILHAGLEKKELILRTKKSLNNDERMDIFNSVNAQYANAEFRGAEQFGPSVGSEIQKKAMFSILFAAIGMLIYITFRFELSYGISAIIALIHDVLILLAIYSIFKIPMNSSFIAAVLTVVGYSINDTIVVFDRVRENVRHAKKVDFLDLANDSLNQTITRSINTSLTTAFVIGSLYFLGVEAIKDFAFPLLAGVLAGTYSSIFIASPIWALWKNFAKDKKKVYKAS